MITALDATKAYGAVQKSMGIDPGVGGASATGGGFGDILKSAMTDVMKSTKTAETQMAAQVHGKAELVVQDAASYQKLLQVAEEARVLEGIRKGLEDLEAGRTMGLDSFKEHARQKHGIQV